MSQLVNYKNPFQMFEKFIWEKKRTHKVSNNNWKLRLYLSIIGNKKLYDDKIMKIYWVM